MKTFEVAFDSGNKFNFYLDEEKVKNNLLDSFLCHFGKPISYTELNYVNYDNISIIKDGLVLNILFLMATDKENTVKFIDEKVKTTKTINNCYFLNYTD